MIHPLPEIPRKVLGKGVLCHLGSAHPSGPHVTPVVFALHGSSLWVTTSRSSVKARTWRRDDRVGGLVRDGRRAVTFAGRLERATVRDRQSDRTLTVWRPQSEPARTGV